jgi:NADP-dependent 3-hydroxy acid dehydrogenase YdfG
MAMHTFGDETTAEEVARSADLRGRLAVVTGGSSGIGIETARALTLVSGLSD